MSTDDRTEPIPGTPSEHSEPSALGFQLFETGLTLAELDLHGGVFWDEAAQWSEKRRLEGLAAAVLSRQPHGRTWVFMDTPASTSTRAVGAVLMARELARHGKKVLLLDGDDHRPDLTRWAGRFEKEGWIDYLRYGASLTTCSVPLPWEGEPGLFLGVGSFCPAQAVGEEIHLLLERLRQQADDIVISAPLGDEGRAWAKEATVRLLCWDRLAHSRAASEATAAGLNAAGTPVVGLLGFGPAEQEWARKAEVATGPAETEAPAETEPAIWEVDSRPEYPEADHRRRGSSGVFWGLAGVLAVLVIVIGGVWFGIVQKPGRSALDRRSTPQAIADMGPGAAVLEQVTPAVVALDSVPRPPAASADLAQQTWTQSSPPPGESIQPARPETAAPGAAESMPEFTSTSVAAATEGTSGGATGPTLSTEVEAPYRLPVGQDGWALHVYSLADSSSARAQIDELERRGIRTAERLVELPGKGRWHRIYVGSFGSRQEAAAAIPELLARLKADWAMPYRFR
jgi:septal ring-binding cell division protein DamX